MAASLEAYADDNTPRQVRHLKEQAERVNLTAARYRAPSTRWDTVHGELMTFDDPEKRLPALDALEGYVPGEEGLYERVLVPVEVADEAVLAWTYRVMGISGVYLPGGSWPAE